MTGNALTSPAPVASAVTMLKRGASSLSPTELDELAQHITVLQRLSGRTKSKASVPDAAMVTPVDAEWQERIIYDALAGSVAKQLGVRSAMPLKAFRKTPIYSQWCQALARALEQHSVWFPRVQRTVTVSMLCLYADMVIANLNSPEHPHGFGWRSVCWGLENLGVIVDKNFPDYARNGLLPLVAQLRTNPIHENDK